MVRLRGMPRPGPPGRGMGRPMPRHMRPEPMLPPFVMPRGRGRLIRGHPMRPGPPRLPPPRMAPPLPPGLGLPPPLPPRRLPLPRPPHPPLPPRDLPPLMGRRPLPPPPMSRRPGLRMPPMPMLPIPPLGRPPVMRVGPPFLRGRGGVVRRGVKRLGATANGRAKKSQKRKEKTEEMELNKPWVTEALKVEIHKKYQLYEAAKEKKTESDWQAYKDQRILVNKITNTAKLEYLGSHPEAGEFFCEVCERGYHTQELLDTHLSGHKVCGIDGCVFDAHPKIVQIHVKSQHDSGLYKSIVFSQNPEDVAQWIAARKSHYPTKENVERKTAQTSEMIQRGERIPMQDKERFRNRSDWKRQRNQNTRNVDSPRQKHRKKADPSFQVETNLRDPEAWRGDLPKFPGTVAFPVVKDEPVDVDEGNHISDEESEPVTKQDGGAASKPLFSNVLASLMMNYGSDSDDEIEDIPPTSVLPGVQTNVLHSSISSEQNISIRTEEGTAQIVDSRVKREEPDNSDNGPEEVAIQREDTTNEPVLELERKEKPCENKNAKSKTTEAVKPKWSNLPVRTPMKRIQLSLLEKLLQNEIRHERTAILQCVRYVVSNNFLGCGSSNPQN